MGENRLFYRSSNDPKIQNTLIGLEGWTNFFFKQLLLSKVLFITIVNDGLDQDMMQKRPDAARSIGRSEEYVLVYHHFGFSLIYFFLSAWSDALSSMRNKWIFAPTRKMSFPHVGNSAFFGFCGTVFVLG